MPRVVSKKVGSYDFCICTLDDDKMGLPYDNDTRGIVCNGDNHNELGFAIS